MTTHFVSASSLSSLSNTVNAALCAGGNLLEVISADLSERQHARIAAVMRSGGRVGIELCSDALGTPSVSLVLIELKGARHVLLEVASTDTGTTTPQ